MTDTVFSFHISTPKHGHSKGSTVFIDKAHHNYHTAFQRYAPLSKVLASDGYVVKEIQERFTKELLRNVEMLIIANALDSLMRCTPLSGQQNSDLS